LSINDVLLEGTSVGNLSSPEKVLFLLKRLGEPPYEMGVTELAREMCAAKSGVHKLLALLVRESFLVQNGATRRYSLGPAVFRLGNVYSDMKGIGEVARGVMEAIAKITGTSVFVGIREGDEAYLAYKVDSPEGFIYQGQVGRRFPIHAAHWENSSRPTVIPKRSAFFSRAERSRCVPPGPSPIRSACLRNTPGFGNRDMR
jgi:hypothetical protein